MQTLATFTGDSWSISSSDPDTTTTWYIDPGSTYPLLRNPAADMPYLTNEGTVDITATGFSETYGNTIPTLTYTCSSNATVCGSLGTYLTGAWL